MSATQDYVALDWIKGEISETLQQAQTALEATAETPDDMTSLRACLTALHQVHGTLKMLELSSPIKIAAEMEELAQALMGNEVPDIGQAQEVLMQSILQMPSFLDRIQKDQTDSEQLVLPLVNNMRVARGLERVDGEEAAGPVAGFNLEPFSMSVSDDVVTDYTAAGGAAIVRKLRRRFQQALVALLKKTSPRENLKLLAQIFARLVKVAGESPLGNLSLVALAAVEGVASGAIKLDSALAGVLRSIDGQLKKQADGDGIDAPVDPQIAEALLDIVAAATTETARIALVKRRFAPVAEPSAGQGFEDIAFGPDDETVATVARILTEELRGITDKLDLYVRSSEPDKQELIDLLPMLEQVNSTLSIVSLTEHENSVAEQIEVIRALEAGVEEPSEEVLLDMAGAFLKIESVLAGLIGEDENEDSIGDIGEAEAAVIKETRAGLAGCKDAIIEFVSGDFERSRIEQLPETLMNLRGGLSIINQSQCGDILAACSDFVQIELLDKARHPELSELDDLADAITSIDYFLERFLENPKEPYLQMVEVAEGAISKLGYVPGVASSPETFSDVGSDVGSDAEPEVEPLEEQTLPLEDDQPPVHEPATVLISPEIELESTPEEELETDQPAVSEALPSDSQSADALVEPEVLEPEVDDEIIEIFVEEAQEVLETIQEFLPQWRNNRQDEDARSEVRRAFHTLKGSGRMVGANVLGELAWSVENMLNRVIDETIKASDPMLALIEDVVASVPEGIATFESQNQQAFHVDEMVARAEAFMAGQSPAEEILTTPTVETESSIDQEAEPSVDQEVESSVDQEAEPSVDQEAEPSVDQEAESSVDQEAESSVDQEADVEEAGFDDIELDDIDLDDIDLDVGTEPAVEEQAELDEVEFDVEAEADVGQEAAFDEIDFEVESNVDEQAGLDEIDFDLEEAFDAEDDAAFESPTAPEEIELEEIEPEDTVLEHAVEADADAADEIVVSLDEDDAELVDEFEFDDLSLEETEASVADDAESELDTIFIEEATARLSSLHEFLLDPGDVDENLVAAYHTLKGSGAMANVPAISDIAGPMESLARHLQVSGMTDHAQEFAVLVAGTTALVEQVLADLDGKREAIDGAEELILQSNSLLERLQGGAVATFDFVPIKLLGKPDTILRAWNPVEIDELVSELRQARGQADAISQESLAALTSALIEVHDKAGGSRPSQAILDSLITGHESLVLMFDQIAASQEVMPAEDIVETLRSVELSPAEDLSELQDLPESDESQTATLLPEDDIDDDILAIFLDETEELLEGIDESVYEWSLDTSDESHRDNLLRHLHTLKGGSRLAGLNSLGEFTHNFESYLIALQQDPVALDDEFFALVNARQDDLTRRVGIYQKLAAGQASDAEIASMRYEEVPGATVASTGSAETPLEQGIEPETADESTLESVPAPAATDPAAEAAINLPEDEIDDDVMPIFMEEAEELLEGIDESILDWSNDTADSAHLDLLLRHLHTLKGSSRLAGLNSLGEYTHNFETYLTDTQQNSVPLDDDFFASVNVRQDEITRRIEIYQKLLAGEATEDELASLRTDAPAVRQVPASDGAPLPRETAAEAPPVERQAPQAQTEMIRVSSDLLADLISLAGEASISRGRVEQQIRDFGESLEEMEDTIHRIREHVRRLEIEAESRETVFRTTHAENEKVSSFDELEMDRYTMLQEISRVLSEGASDMMDLKDTLVNRSRDAETVLHQQARINRELQEGLTRTRMVPFARLIPRLRRIVRTISGEVDKSVRFDAFNVEGELDRNVLDRIVAPLEHMLRNAVDHGIESAAERRAAGKPAQGRISLRLDREGGYVVLTVGDDGAGIDVNAVRKKALERGLITADSPITDPEVMQFIMNAGFSTAQKVTQISGRGVGMDVVTSEIKQLGGTITIDSMLGVGTEFTIRLPFTVSINRALMVVIQEETYAVPLNTIEGIYRVSPYELEAYYQPDAPMFEAAGQPYRLVYMGKLLGRAEEPNLEGQVALLPVILARSGDNAVAIQVDRVIGSREVVVKSLGTEFGEVNGVSGATVLGDGSVVIILDVMSLVTGGGTSTTELQTPEEYLAATSVKTVMIVDDSVTVRKVTSRLMERNGWEVITAKDGIEAVSQLQDIRPTVVLLDIEMPRMDGFEVLRTVRRDERLKDLPIIMITSRTGEKHQQQALELGVNRFLGKPFQEASLMTTIEEVLEEAKV